MTSRLLRIMLASPLLACAAWAADFEAAPFRLTASWAGLPTGELSVALRPAGGRVKVKPLQGGIDYPSLVTHAKFLEITLAPEAPRSPFVLAKLPIPEKGDDFALILSGETSRSTSAWLVPSGLDALPPGGTYVINHSPAKIRVGIEDQSLELDAEGARLHPLTAKNRIVSRLKIEALDGKQWSLVRSNRLILSPGQRFILLIGPTTGNPEPFFISTIVDSNTGAYQKALPLTAPTPQPDQPAK